MKKIVITILTLSLLLTGCSNKTEEESPQNSSSVSQESVAPAEPVKDANFNPLTGEHTLRDAAVGNRPVSVMVSNIKAALPQRGISQADMAYEVLVEGGITRIMALFSDYTKVPEVGPVRSVRHYYPNLSLPLNTIFVHWGGSNQGYSEIKKLGINNLDGMIYSNSCFITDKALGNQKGQEHANFIDADGISKGIQKIGIDVAVTVQPPFQFMAKDKIVPLGGGAATNVIVPFSQYCKATFDYDSTTKKYAKGQFGKPHIDATNNEQVMVDNVFALFADVQVIDQKSGLLDISLTSGTGYYISRGEYIALNWSKEDSASPIAYTDSTGTPLKVNPGKSWVCILNKTSKDSMVFEKAAS